MMFASLGDTQLKRIFAKDGVEASWADHHPLTWGAESAKLSFAEDEIISCSTISPDEELLALGIRNKAIVYSLRKLELVAQLSVPYPTVSHIEWQTISGQESVAYKVLVFMNYRNIMRPISSAGEVLVWNLDQDGKEVATNVDPQERANPKVLASAASQAVRDILENYHNRKTSDVESAELVKHFEPVLEQAVARHSIRHLSRIEGQAFGFGSKALSNDSTMLALHCEPVMPSTSDSKTAIEIWDVTNEVPVRRHNLLGHTDKIMWVGFSPDDKIIASSSWDRSLKLWSTSTGNVLHDLGPSTGQNWTGAFSPDGTLVAHGCGGSETGVYVWDVETGETVLKVNKIPKWVRALAWNSDSTQLACGTQGGSVHVVQVRRQDGVPALEAPLQEWKLHCETHLTRLYFEIGSIIWFDNGEKLGFSTGTDNAYEVYDFTTNKRWRFAPDGTKYPRPHSSHCMLWYQRQRLFVTVDADNTVRLWHLD